MNEKANDKKRGGEFRDHIDLHMHSSVSDGTDTPEELVARVKEAGLELFALTDHDAIKGCTALCGLLKEGDPAFITGAEFSCKDEEGQYHILGYGYAPESVAIHELVEKGHVLRMKKLKRRMDFLESEFGFTFSEEDLEKLFSLDNPGKPHIGNLMVEYGYARSKDEAISEYIEKLRVGNEYVRPEEAIEGILRAGGIPVLAHPSYGRGDDLIMGAAMESRLEKLIKYGLKGVEAFYSGFTPKLQNEMLSFAGRFGLYITAGSDYHGKNKLVRLGDTNLDSVEKYPEGLERFLGDVTIIKKQLP